MVYMLQWLAGRGIIVMALTRPLSLMSPAPRHRFDRRSGRGIVRVLTIARALDPAGSSLGKTGASANVSDGEKRARSAIVLTVGVCCHSVRNGSLTTPEWHV